MPTYLIWNENQSYRSSANARRNKTHTRNQLPIAGLTSDSTQTGKHGNRMPIAGLTSDSEPTNTHRKPTANRWTYVRLHTHT